MLDPVPLSGTDWVKLEPDPVLARLARGELSLNVSVPVVAPEVGAV